MACLWAVDTERIKEICSREKSDGKTILAKALKIYPVEDDDLRKSIYVDFLYDNISFAAEKGFTWSQIHTVLNFADEMLSCVKMGKCLTSIVNNFMKDGDALALGLGERNFKIYTDWFFSTFMAHYQLYHYVFREERDKQIPNVQIDVLVPPDVQEMKTAKRIDVWNYEQTILDMERKACEKINQILLMKEKVMDNINTTKEISFKKILEMEPPVTKELLKEIIQEVLQSYTSAFMESLKINVEELKEDLQFKIEKTSFPRPQILGPPSRFKPKSPPSLSTGSQTQVKSRTSSRSSRKSNKSSKSGKSVKS